MSRLSAIDPATAAGKTKELFDTVKRSLGLVPNMTRVMANSPAVLQGYIGLSGALNGGLLDAKTREQIALAIAQENQCDYCLSAHTAIGKMVGLDQQTIIQSREGTASTPRTAAALVFAKRVLETRGQISDTDLAAVREAGWGEGEIAEIIGHVALNVLTNYFNVATDVEIDFPKVSFRQIAY